MCVFVQTLSFSLDFVVMLYIITEDRVHYHCLFDETYEEKSNVFLMTFAFLTAVDLKVVTFSARTETFCPFTFCALLSKLQATSWHHTCVFKCLTRCLVHGFVRGDHGCFQNSENPFFPAFFLSSPLLLNLSKVIYFCIQITFLCFHVLGDS